MIAVPRLAVTYIGADSRTLTGLQEASASGGEILLQRLVGVTPTSAQILQRSDVIVVDFASEAGIVGRARSAAPKVGLVAVVDDADGDQTRAAIRQGADEVVGPHGWPGDNPVRLLRQAQVRAEMRTIADPVDMADWRDLALWRTLTDALPDLVFIKDREARLVACNGAAMERAGAKSLDELLGKSNQDLFPGERGEMYDRVDREVMAGFPVLGVPELILDRTGKVQHYESTKIPMRNERGEITGLLGIIRNVTGRWEAEEALRHSERRFRAIIENGADSVALIDGNGVIRYISPAVKRIEGFEPEEIIGSGSLEYTHPDDIPYVMKKFEELFANPGKPIQGFWRRRHKDGRWLWLEGVTTNLLSDPAVGAIVTNYRDVTERVEAEAALRASAERFRLLNSIGEAARQLSEPKDLVSECLRLMGEFLGASRCGYGEVDLARGEIRAFGEYRRDGSSEDSLRKGADFGSKIAGALLHGETVVLLDVERELEGLPGAVALASIGTKALVCVPMMRGGKIRAVVTAHDTSPRKWTPEEVSIVQEVAERCWSMVEHASAVVALQRSEEHLRTVVDNSPLPVVLLDRTGVLLEVNKAGLELVEVERLEDIPRRKLDSLVAPKDLRKLLIFHREVCSGKKGNLLLEVEGVRGTHRWIELVSSPLSDGCGGQLHLAIVRDITETRRLEEQLRQSQKMDAVGHLAGGIAHDFNNLLTVILGYSDVLLDKSTLGASEERMINEIRKSGERAASLTKQLLAFSRKQVLAPTTVNLNDTVKGVESLLSRLIGEDISLRSTLDEKLWAVSVDVGQLEQVMVNLAINARDAMPRGGSLTIETANVEWTEQYCSVREGRKPGAYVMVALSDSGCGMSEDLIAHIFEPFFTTKGPGKGTGLGLAVVHGIVKQSEGHVDVYSEPGVGTSVKIFFPAVRKVHAGTVNREESDLQPGEGTLLLVEDEDGVRRLAKLTLESYGYEVLDAANGRSALALAEKHPGRIDLLVTDVVMPVMGGRELSEKLSLTRPGVPVLFMSGYTDDAVVRHGIIGAAFAFLQKPFSPASLARKVGEVLGKKMDN